MKPSMSRLRFAGRKNPPFNDEAIWHFLGVFCELGSIETSLMAGSGWNYADYDGMYLI